MYRKNWERIYFIFGLVKQSIWYRRCVLVFENKNLCDNEILKRIRKSAMERIKLDQIRMPITKFTERWLKDSSLFSVTGEVVNFCFP